jgi:hypothetical protein
MKLNRLVPTYGNWGGPGWCGGEWQDDPAKTNWDVAAKDEMDAAFKNHDYFYQHYPEARKNADLDLVWRLAGCKPTSAYGVFYKFAATLVFFPLGVFRQ